VSGKSRQQLTAIAACRNSVFRVQQVRVRIRPVELPGHPAQGHLQPLRQSCATAAKCSRRGIHRRPCDESAYFSNAREIIWADMNWRPPKCRSFRLRTITGIIPKDPANGARK